MEHRRTDLGAIVWSHWKVGIVDWRPSHGCCLCTGQQIPQRTRMEIAWVEEDGQDSEETATLGEQSEAPFLPQQTGMHVWFPSASWSHWSDGTGSYERWLYVERCGNNWAEPNWWIQIVHRQRSRIQSRIRLQENPSPHGVRCQTWRTSQSTTRCRRTPNWDTYRLSMLKRSVTPRNPNPRLSRGAKWIKGMVHRHWKCLPGNVHKRKGVHCCWCWIRTTTISSKLNCFITSRSSLNHPMAPIVFLHATAKKCTATSAGATMTTNLIVIVAVFNIETLHELKRDLNQHFKICKLTHHALFCCWTWQKLLSKLTPQSPRFHQHCFLNWCWSPWLR